MIFYFSATGNTLWVARQIGEATSDRLVPVTTGHADVEVALAEGERLGFCFPVHGWRPPELVRRFVRRLLIRSAKAPYVYAVCTAGDTVGEALDIFRTDLARQGLRLVAEGSLLMPESYVGLPFMDVDTPQREQEKIEASRQRLQGIIADIQRRLPIASPVDVGRWPRINSRLLGSVFHHCIVGDAAFSVQADRCVRCGRCAQVCVVADIACEKDQLPRWRHNGQCMSCFSCYHHCPAHAISYGWRTKGKGQYYMGHRARKQ